MPATKGEPDPKKVKATMGTIEEIVDQLKKQMDLLGKMQAMVQKDPGNLSNAQKVLADVVKNVGGQLKDLKEVEKEVDELTV